MKANKRHILVAGVLFCALVSLAACNFSSDAWHSDAAEDAKIDEMVEQSESTAMADAAKKYKTEDTLPQSAPAQRHAASGADLLDTGTPGHLKSQIKNYAGFRVSFNRDNHTPNWVAWELTETETEGEVPRYKKFWCDEDIAGCPETSDYTHSGYDRGHMCPAADNKLTEQMMIACFTMANICPQAHSLNTGAWKTLENKERLWAERDGSIVIVAGPIYEASDRTRIGETGVRVPSAFFKVLIEPYSSSPGGIGFIYPNMSSPGDMYNYAMSIDEVEKITGLDFFRQLPDDLENELESRTPRRWKK